MGCLSSIFYTKTSYLDRIATRRMMAAVCFKLAGKQLCAVNTPFSVAIRLKTSLVDRTPEPDSRRTLLTSRLRVQQTAIRPPRFQSYACVLIRDG